MSLETLKSFWGWSIFNLFNLIYQGTSGFISLNGKAGCTLVHLQVSHQDGSLPCATLTFKRSWSWSQVPRSWLVLKSTLNLMLNLGLEVGTPCPQKPRQPGCGRGGPLWVPSLWGTSWRTCFISDHTLCFLQCILFHRLLKRGEPAFKMILAFCHAKLN